MAAAKKTPLPTPEPKPTHVVCSVCDQPWDKHGAEPTLLSCIAALKAALAARPRDPWRVASFVPGAYTSTVARGIPLPPN